MWKSCWRSTAWRVEVGNVSALLEDPRPVSRSVNEQYGARRLFVSMQRHEAERSSAAQLARGRMA
jgi:hypothetical protein